MGTDPGGTATATWRRELPTLIGRSVTLREPVADDVGPLVDLLSTSDASRFGIDEAIGEAAVQAFIDRVARDRAAGVAFSYVITVTGSCAIIGLVLVRGLDPAFESAEWDYTLTPSARGTGAFIETARLVGSFVFAAVGAYRIEARVLLQNGRANGALRKLGAVQEGILRRSTRRGGEYLDQVLWSVLKDDWSDHRISTAPRVH
jgi:RimJ/RimL family protein N-acetyltransferase